MLAAPIPANDEYRLECIATLDVLDSPRERIYDHLTELASQIFQVPMALISIVDRERQWLKSGVGLDASETPRDISFCGHVVHSLEPLIVADTHEDTRFADNPLVIGGPRIRFYAGLPILLEPEICVGTLCIIDTRPRHLDDTALKQLEALRNVIEDLFVKVRESIVDPLTGCFNRRMFDKTARKMVSKALRHESALSCVCMDIDHFKRVNDTHGHDAGDVVLKEFAIYVEKQIRSEDYLFRLGGEEFSLLLPNTDSFAALKLCERIRRGLKDLKYYFDTEILTVTSSFGVSEFLHEDDDLHSMLKRGDQALYAAKSAGRDRTVVSTCMDGGTPALAPAGTWRGLKSPPTLALTPG